MFGLVIEIGWKAGMSLVIAVICVNVFDQLLTFGENDLQITVVFAFYIYCVISLFSASAHKLFHLLALPIFTQFIHLFQKYSFPAGANSLWRLMPFIILGIYFGLFFISKTTLLSTGERYFLTLWVVFQTAFLLISPNLVNVALGGFLIFIVILPSFFIYLKAASEASDFQHFLEMYFFALFLILGTGTFGLVFAGAAYKGSDNLLATRNITDTNVTMAYFILLWPLVLLYNPKRNFSGLIRLVCIALFVSIVIFSFSRGAVILIFPYLLITALIAKIQLSFTSLPVLVLIAILCIPDLTLRLQDLDMAYFWTLRFGDIAGSDSVLAKLQQSSGRAEIHAIAYALFLHSPLVGHGTASFEVMGPGYREAHSLFYTVLAEQGLIGIICIYGLYAHFLILLFKIIRFQREHSLLIISLIFYLLFNHTVGSVFVILPAKSVTVNCIAPVLLMCLYFYARNVTCCYVARFEKCEKS